MIRAMLVLAAALFAAGQFLVTPAAACISCEYVPEVVNTPVPGAKKYKKKTVAKERPAKKRVKERAKAPPKAKEDTYTAAKKPTPAPSSPDEDTRQSADASTDVSSGAASKPVEEAKAPAEVGCMKFVPTAGTTVPVPCD